MRKHIDCDLTGFAYDFSVCMHPERNGAPYRNALSLIREESLEAKMIAVVCSWEDPEKVHAVKVSGSKEAEYAVVVNCVGTELKTSALIASVHDNGEQSAGSYGLTPVAGDLHSCHGTCQDHVDRLRDVDQFAHTYTVENGLETGAVSSLAYGGVKSDSGTELSALWHTAASNPIPALILKSRTMPDEGEEAWPSALPGARFKGLWVKGSSRED